MNFFDLPTRSIVNRVIAKTSFDAYTNTKQKKLLSEKVLRITWTHKLSVETVNLESKYIKEIQVFKVELKVKDDIGKLLDIIDRAIPYHIVFWVQHEDSAYLSTSSKHPHPTNEDNSVIDWTFRSDWIEISRVEYTLNLKRNLDEVYKDLCVQITGSPVLSSKSLKQIVDNQQQLHSLKREIEIIQSKISKCRQFNEKVALNQKLNLKLRELETLESQSREFQ